MFPSKREEILRDEGACCNRQQGSVFASKEVNYGFIDLSEKSTLERHEDMNFAGNG